VLKFDEGNPVRPIMNMINPQFSGHLKIWICNTTLLGEYLYYHTKCTIINDFISEYDIQL